MAKIYLSGAMTDTQYHERSGWRKNLTNELSRFSSLMHLKIFDPTTYYDIDDIQVDDREAMLFDLHHLRNSDVLIYYEQGIKSIGSGMEIALAKELRIPVIILLKQGIQEKELHPWIRYMSSKICRNTEELIEYIGELIC